MTDLTRILPPGWDSNPHIDPPEVQLALAMKQAGIEPPADLKIDGQLHRFSTKGRKKDDSGWYIIFPDEPQAGRFGCWRDGVEVTFVAEIDREIDATERMAIMRRHNEARAERDRERERKAEMAADTVSKIWSDAGAASPDHPYLKRKGIQPHGSRVTGDGRLMVPLFDNDGDLSSLQYISESGDKKYHPGGTAKSCGWMIGDLDKTLYIAEGFATAATINEVTSEAVAIAYSAGNIVATTKIMRQRYPSTPIVIVADNDESGVGKNYADQAAAKYGARVVMPPELGDANDYAQAGNDLNLLLNPPQSDWLTKAKDFSAEPAPISWLVKHWLQDKALIMVHGPSGGGKTFLVLDWCLNIASQFDQWFGHKVHPGTVVYLAGEGHHGLKSRVAAWRQHHGVDDPDLYLSGSGCDLNTPNGYMKVVEAVSGLETPPRLIVVDTLHRFLDGDENSAQDAKTMLDACNALMTEFNCSVLLVHHTGVSDEAQHRARGSSAWRGALEIEISVTPPKRDGDSIQVIQRKAKDSEVAEPVYIDLTPVDIKGWKDEDGDPVSSCVITEGAQPVRVEKDPLDAHKRLFERAWFDCGHEKNEDGMAIISHSALASFLEKDPIKGNEKRSARTVKNMLMPSYENKLIGALINGEMLDKKGSYFVVADGEWNSIFMVPKGP